MLPEASKAFALLGHTSAKFSRITAPAPCVQPAKDISVGQAIRDSRQCKPFASHRMQALLKVSKDDSLWTTCRCDTVSPPSGCSSVRKVQVWMAAAVSCSTPRMLPVFR